MIIQEAFRTIYENRWLLFVLVVTGWLINKAWWFHKSRINLPTAGIPLGIFGPWKAAINWVTQSDLILREGVRLYRGRDGGPFKISTFARYYVCVTKQSILEEIEEVNRNSGVDIFSIEDAIRDIMQVDYTMHPDIIKYPYHLQIIKQKLTTRLTAVLPDLIEEATITFEKFAKIGLDWAPIDHEDIMMKCISGTSNRVFVGVPLCRNKDLLDSIADYTKVTIQGTEILSWAPKILKPVVAKVILSKGKAFNRVRCVLGPIFEERVKKAQQMGEKWVDRPDDMIQWIIDYAPPRTTIDAMCFRVLALNFAAIHTSYLSLEHVLFDLAADLNLQNILREEIELMVGKYGWTKQSLSMMKKLDSVLRESQRVNTIGVASTMRKVKKDYTFADGTFLPKGTVIFTPGSAIHHSEEYYDNPDEFDGLRWSRLREDPRYRSRYQMVMTDDAYLPFGHGLHACPGRFFAANELKVLLSYIICNYQFRTEDGKRPENQFIGFTCMPDLKAKVYFKERPDRKSSILYRDVTKMYF